MKYVMTEAVAPEGMALLDQSEKVYVAHDANPANYTEEMKDADALIVRAAPAKIVNKAVMEAAPRLKVIGSNALDHSPPQGTIYVTVQKTDCFLHISITDEGGGFTPEALHHAQEQFFMGDKSRTSNMHFGMGLYITSSIIKQHGGQLVLSNSKKTGGAQAIIKIPY